jgi:hypothetical protein
MGARREAQAVHGALQHAFAIRRNVAIFAKLPRAHLNVAINLLSLKALELAFPRLDDASAKGTPNRGTNDTMSSFWWRHRAIGKKWSGFYKRYGDSFVPLSTADIRDLFFRNFSPDLELRVVTEATGSLEPFPMLGTAVSHCHILEKFGGGGSASSTKLTT